MLHSATMFLLVLSNMAHGEEVADAFRYPVTEDGQRPREAYTISQGFRPLDTNSNHDGVDFDYDYGDPVYAVANGYVMAAAGDANDDSWGLYVHLRHLMPDGSYVYTHYAHCQKLNVSTGQDVIYGQQICEMGSTGFSTGSHLHFQVITGTTSRGCGYYPSDDCGLHWSTDTYWSRFINPLDFLDDRLAGSTSGSDLTSSLNEMEGSDIHDLNSYSGHNQSTWINSQIGECSGTYEESEGDISDARVYECAGGYKDGAIIIHKDSAYAVPIWGDMWDIYDGNESSWTIDDTDCNVNWFGDGNGAESKLGLPITSVYYVDNRGRWRQDFQRGYFSKDDDTNTIHINCYSAYSSESEPGSPGWVDWGEGWVGQLSSETAAAYWRNGAKEVVGYPFDNGGGPNLHIWEGVVIQDFTGGDNDDNAIILNLTGLDDDSQNGASVVRNGFWSYYKANRGQLYFGAPLGDEMDINPHDGTLRGYDPYCDYNHSGWVGLSERERCITEYCGFSILSDWTSMQRFKHTTLCWDDDAISSEVKEDPKRRLLPATTGEIAEEFSPVIQDGGSTIYLYRDYELFPFASWNAYLACGFGSGDSIAIDEDDAELVSVGDSITSTSWCGGLRNGDLIMGSSGTVYLIGGGKKWPLASRTVFEACFGTNGWDDIITVADSVLTGFTTGDTISQAVQCGILEQGALISDDSNGATYAVDQDEIRYIGSATVFDACGYSWGNVVSTPHYLVEDHEQGDNVSSSDCP